MRRGASLSADGVFRWTLWRRWDDGPTMTFIMLNPSSADADLDDPTIRRCIGFARREDCGGILVVNLYPYRTHKPKYLVRAIEEWPGLPVIPPDGGEEGLRQLIHAFVGPTGPVVAAWGAHPVAASQAEEVCYLAGLGGVPLWCLGKTKTGAPRHPLYVKADTPLEPWP